MMNLLRIFLLFALLLCAERAAADQPSTSTLRIITLAPSLTETVFALGSGEQVVAVTDYCFWPEEVSSRPKIGGLYTLNTERLLSLKPTLVLHSADHRGAIDQLRRFGVRTELVPVESMADIYASITRVGELVGAPTRAERINATIRGQLDEISARYENARRVRALYVVDNSAGELRQIYALGPGTFLNEILERAGCENVMKDSAAFYPLVSREYLIAHPADLIITSKQEDTPAGRAAWLDFTGRSAANAPAFLFLDDRHLTIPGPSIGLRGIELAKRIDEARKTIE